VVEVMMRTWPMLLVRGLVALGIGILALQHPGMTVLSLMFAVAALAAIDGCVALVLAATSYGSAQSRRALIATGLAGVAAAAIVAWPGAALAARLIVAACWAVMRGVFEMLTALELRREVRGEWMMFASGLLSVIFGVALVVSPLTGVTAIGLFVAVYALSIGLLESTLAFRARRPWPELVWRR